MSQTDSSNNIVRSDAEELNKFPSNDDNVTEMPKKKPSILGRIRKQTIDRQPVSMEIDDWLELCKTDKMAYANFADRLQKAIGSPEIVDTKKSDKAERAVFGQKKILRYEPFSELYDKENEISKIVTYINDGANGILVLRGPVGSGKTEIATELEKLAEKEPMYLLKCKKTDEISPFNDTPLCLLSDAPDMVDEINEEYGIPKRYLNEIKSKWVAKRLDALDNDQDESDAFEVVKVYPSRDRQLGIAKLDPKDPQSPDINALIGEKDFSKVGEEDPLDPDKVLSAGDPDAYIPGAFSKSHGGVLHGAEFFRNNPAMLNTFLEAVTEGYFTGDSGIGMLPMNQLIVLTTNDPVWQAVLKKADSDALHNRAVVVDVGYTLRMSEEIKIYKKLLAKNGLDDKDMAPETLNVLAEFAVVTRLKDGIDGALAQYNEHTRARVLNGETNVDGAEGKIPKIHELKTKASLDEGLDGFSIRDAERVLKACFNARANEGIIEADKILMVETLFDFIKNADDKTIPSEKLREKYKDDFLATIAKKVEKDVRDVVNKALVDADDGACQTQFDKYYEYAKAWVDEEILTEDGEEIDREAINKYLETMEKKAGETQPEQFRRSIVNGVKGEIVTIAERNIGKAPEDQEPLVVKWTSYEPLKKVIEAQHEADIEKRRHIIKAKSDADLKTPEEKRQYSQFYENMDSQGYTRTMTNRMLKLMM